MVLSLAFPIKLMKRSSKTSNAHATFPFNHPRQRQGSISNDDSSSQGTTASLDDDSASSHASSTKWEVKLSSSGSAVNFDTSLNEEYANDAMVKNELQDLWYQPSDYQLFRSMALDASQQIIATEKRNRAPHSYQRVLERTYMACCNHSDLTNGTGNDMMEVDGDDEATNDANDACDVTKTDSFTTERDDENIEQCTSTIETRNQSHAVISDDDFIHLQRWLEVGSSRIGLEKWSIRTISTTRSTRRDTMIETIMALQQQHRFTRTLKRPSHVTGLDYDQQQQSLHAEFVRGTCERLSQPSCLFSVVMAKGLAAAVAKENFYNSI